MIVDQLNLFFFLYVCVFPVELDKNEEREKEKTKELFRENNIPKK